MRIVGEIPHPRLKITLMQHGRYLLKLEDREVEVVYRFRDGEGVASLADVQRILDLGLLQEAEAQLQEMVVSRRRYVRGVETEEFPEIV